MSDQTPQDPYAVPPAGGYPPPPPAGYPAPTYPAAGYPGGQAPKPGAGALSIVALVVAIIALIICWFPFVGGAAALIALILGVIAWVSAKKSGRPAGLAIAATIVSALALLVGIVISIAFLALIGRTQDADEYCKRVSTTQATYDQCMSDQVSDWFGIDTTS
ncbi:MAG: CD20-like domain-containing protein [Actinomycetia bacterium]|nr:CD20-like domain-containing protein [Actinomycetes bacterium]